MTPCCAPLKTENGAWCVVRGAWCVGALCCLTDII